MSIIPLNIGDYNEPFSADMLGRGFKFNLGPGEEKPFKRRVWKAEHKKYVFTNSHVVSKVINNADELAESMEVEGKLRISYGPATINGEGRSGSFMKTLVSSRRKVVVVYRSRHHAYFEEINPDKLVLVEEAQGMGMDAIAEKYGTRYVDKVIYGAQLDVIFTVTSTEDIDTREIAAELKGKIGYGVLSAEFDAKFKEDKKKKKAIYNMDIVAKAVGVKMTVPANPSFEQVNELVTKFNAEYDSKFKSFKLEDSSLLDDIAPVGFTTASIADKMNDMSTDEMKELQDLENRMSELAKAFQETMFWKGKLQYVDSVYKERFSWSPRERTEIYLPFQKRVEDAETAINKRINEMLEFRGKPMCDLVKPDVIIPKKYPETASEDEEMLQGLCGEIYIKCPVTFYIGKDETPAELWKDVYYEGFALKLDNKNKQGFKPWLDGVLKDEKDDTIIATGTPEELLKKYKKSIEDRVLDEELKEKILQGVLLSLSLVGLGNPLVPLPTLLPYRSSNSSTPEGSGQKKAPQKEAS